LGRARERHANRLGARLASSSVGRRQMRLKRLGPRDGGCSRYRRQLEAQRRDKWVRRAAVGIRVAAAIRGSLDAGAHVRLAWGIHGDLEFHGSAISKRRIQYHRDNHRSPVRCLYAGTRSPGIFDAGRKSLAQGEKLPGPANWPLIDLGRCAAHQVPAGCESIKVRAPGLENSPYVTSPGRARAHTGRSHLSRGALI
jgi:hypothetical protein